MLSFFFLKRDNKQARFDDDWRLLRHLTWWRFRIGLLCLLQKQSRDVGWTRVGFRGKNTFLVPICEGIGRERLARNDTSEGVSLVDMQLV